MYKKGRRGFGRQGWDRIWLEEYRQFLRLSPGESFTIEVKRVIDFLIDIRRRGKKAWQRMQALKAIKLIAANELRLATDHLNAGSFAFLVTSKHFVIRSGHPIESLSNVVACGMGESPCVGIGSRQ